MAVTLSEFAMSHGGLQYTSQEGFAPLRTKDGCYISFARTQFAGEDLSSKEKVLNFIRVNNLDVLEGTNQQGSRIGEACFTIVKHSDLYEDLDF